MFILGHLGIGRALAKPFSKGFATKWILIGTLFPDICDKPIFYSIRYFASQSHSWANRALEFFAGSRGITHTALFLIFLTLTSVLLKSRRLGGLCLGIATHLLLDQFSRIGSPFDHGGLPKDLLWPFLGYDFPRFPYSSITEQWTFYRNPATLIGEAIGLLFLLVPFYRKKIKPYFRGQKERF